MSKLIQNQNNFTYNNDHPKFIEAGERMLNEKNKKYETSKNTRHIYAFNQSFFDFIGHSEQYSREYFSEIKKQDFPQVLYKSSELFPEKQHLTIEILSIRTMAKYCEITINITNYSNSHWLGKYDLKVKYVDYFKMKKELNKILLGIVEDCGIPNNFLESEARKNIWDFDFSKINFLHKPSLF